MSDTTYYIASVAHTLKCHEHISFWGPDSRGYRLAITDDRIGRYSAEEVMRSRMLGDGVHCLAVPEEVVKSLLSPMPYFALNGRAQQFYDTPGPVVDNTRANWNRMVAAAFHLPPGIKVKPEVFRGKRSSFALPAAQATQTI